jgi:MOSC domain-containing protein YiiM
VTVRGVPLRQALGKTLRVGEVLLAVTGPCDPCEQMNRTIGPGARTALQGWGGVCALVLEGGTLRPGDAIAVQDPAAPVGAPLG